MIEFDQYDLLKDCVAQNTATSASVIGIEGFQLSGKTKLGSALANDLQGISIDVDCYVHGEDESLPYVERIDLRRLFHDIQNALRSEKCVFISGICLRDVLAPLRISANITIYIKKLSAPYYRWDDGDRLQAYIAGTDHQNLWEIHKSDFAYHANTHPHEKADIIFTRTES